MCVCVCVCVCVFPEVSSSCCSLVVQQCPAHPPTPLFSSILPYSSYSPLSSSPYSHTHLTLPSLLLHTPILILLPPLLSPFYLPIPVTVKTIGSAHSVKSEAIGGRFKNGRDLIKYGSFWADLGDVLFTTRALAPKSTYCAYSGSNLANMAD